MTCCRARAGPGPKPRVQGPGPMAQAAMPWAKTQGSPGRWALGLRASLGDLGPGSEPRALGPGSEPWVLAGRALGPLGL